MPLLVIYSMYELIQPAWINDGKRELVSRYSNSRVLTSWSLLHSVRERSGNGFKFISLACSLSFDILKFNSSLVDDSEAEEREHKLCSCQHFPLGNLIKKIHCRHRISKALILDSNWNLNFQRIPNTNTYKWIHINVVVGWQMNVLQLKTLK